MVVANELGRRLLAGGLCFCLFCVFGEPTPSPDVLLVCGPGGKVAARALPSGRRTKPS